MKIEIFLLNLILTQIRKLIMMNLKSEVAIIDGSDHLIIDFPVQNLKDLNTCIITIGH